MASENDIGIKITTSGDAKGAEKVSKGLEKIEKSTGKVEKSTKKLDKVQSDFKRRIEDSRAKIERYKDSIGNAGRATEKAAGSIRKSFPTFSRLKKAVGSELMRSAEESARSLIGLVNPVNLVVGAISVGVGLIVRGYQKWKKNQEDLVTAMETTFPQMRKQLDQTFTSQTNLTTATEDFSEAQKEASRLTGDRVSAIEANARAIEELQAAELELEKARIGKQVRDGELTEGEGAQKIAALEGAAAERSFQQELETGNKILKVRQGNLTRARQAAAQARQELNAATEALKKFEKSNDFDRAAGLNPALNRNVSSATHAEAIARRGNDPERIAQAAERSAKAQAERREAVLAEQARLKGVVGAAGSRFSAAQNRARSAFDATRAQEAEVVNQATTGREIFRVRQETAALNAAPGRPAAAPAPTPAPTASGGGGGLAGSIGAAAGQVTGSGSASVAARETLGRLQVAAGGSGGLSEAQTRELLETMKALAATLERTDSKFQAEVSQIRSLVMGQRNQSTSRR
jgi:hypothetical protein